MVVPIVAGMNARHARVGFDVDGHDHTLEHEGIDEGFEAGGIWIPLDEDVSCDSSQDVLVVQFSASWVETAAETGEYMETLVYNQEEATE